MGTYWVPETKAELIDWLMVYYGASDNKWHKMAKKQLYAIYYRLRNSDKRI